MMGSFRLAPPGHQAPSPLYVKTHASSMSSMDPTGSPSTRTNGNSFLPPFLRFQSFLASSSPATCVCDHIVRQSNSVGSEEEERGKDARRVLGTGREPK